MLGCIAFLRPDCDPNCRHKFDTTDEVVQIEILQGILPGNELLVKFSEECFDDEECLCATCTAKETHQTPSHPQKFLNKGPTNSRLDQMLQMRPLPQFQLKPCGSISLRLRVTLLYCPRRSRKTCVLRDNCPTLQELESTKWELKSINI